MLKGGNSGEILEHRGESFTSAVPWGYGSNRSCQGRLPEDQCDHLDVVLLSAYSVIEQYCNHLNMAFPSA